MKFNVKGMTNTAKALINNSKQTMKEKNYEQARAEKEDIESYMEYLGKQWREANKNETFKKDPNFNTKHQKLLKARDKLATALVNIVKFLKTE